METIFAGWVKLPADIVCSDLFPLFSSNLVSLIKFSGKSTHVLNRLVIINTRLSLYLCHIRNPIALPAGQKGPQHLDLFDINGSNQILVHTISSVFKSEKLQFYCQPLYNGIIYARV